jgi:hypothetical protein
MAYRPVKLWYPVFGGYNEQQIETIRQDQRLVELSQAQDVISDPLGAMVTRPGFSKVRAAAIAGTPTITGLHYLQDLTDKLIITASDGKTYQDDASPPTEVTAGTAFTTGATVLTRGTIFNNKLLLVSSSRNIPQTVNATPTKADLGVTPARGIDVKSFARRVCMFSPSDGTTTYRSIMSFTSAVDDETAWTAPYAVNFLNFGRTGTDVNLLGGELYKDHLMAFTEDRLYPVYATPSALLPMAFQDSLFTEKGGGPPVIHAVVAANDDLYWISRNRDIKQLSRVNSLAKGSIGYPVRPFLRGLTDAQLTNIVGGWEPKYRLITWAMADAASATHNIVLALHVDTNQFFLHTLSRNAFCNRIVSGQQREIGGGLAGFLYNEYDTSTTGNADDSTAAIDADIMTPRIHHGLPDAVKKVPYVAIEFDPVGSEVVTVQHQLDDATSWTSFAESTYTMTGTDKRIGYFTIPAPYRDIRLRLRDANSGERYRVLRFGFPEPMVLTVARS